MTVSGAAGRLPNTALDPRKLDTAYGKVIRLRDHGTVPPDNPFVNRAGARPEIFSSGHRDQFGIAPHPVTGEMFHVELGPYGGDKVNILKAGGDYGWPYGNEGCDPQTDGTPPVVSLGLHTASTGITYYDGSGFPARYRGSLFATVWGSLFAEPDPYNRLLLRVSAEDDTGIVDEFGSGFEHPIDVFADADGSLLVLDYGSDDPDERSGTLYRIIYTEP
jgi:glucose/arabinose dehydrogenase